MLIFLSFFLFLGKFLDRLNANTASNEGGEDFNIDALKVGRRKKVTAKRLRRDLPRSAIISKTSGKVDGMDIQAIVVTSKIVGGSSTPPDPVSSMPHLFLPPLHLTRGRSHLF